MAQDPQPQKSRSQTLTTRLIKDAFAQPRVEAIPFINTLIRECVGLSASDIFLEPGREAVRARARIDGVLYDLGEISHDNYPEVNSRMKVLAKLDPTEKRKIQEGQFTLNLEGRVVNLRVEVAQTIHGEMIVIRIHEKQTIVMDLSSLGFQEQTDRAYRVMLRSMSGLIIVCGPTGCGKTTTLYSTINKLNEDQMYNVMTIEDPVEFQLSGVNQMQTREDTGFTFAEGLRTILRLSPDVILVGEIRDRETAEIAVESGLTGQLVLTSIHAEDAVGALFRLLDLGIESYLVNSAILGVVAQRLVRKLCVSCRTPTQPTAEELEIFQSVMGRPPTTLSQNNGCLECQNLGFKGRTGIFEVLRMEPEVRDLIRKKVNEDTLRLELRKADFVSLLQDGMLKSEQGMTTISEVLRNSLRTT